LRSEFPFFNAKECTMLDLVVNLFSRCNPRRDAILALTRIMNRYDLSKMGYEEGLQPERRAREERHIALGVWLFPCGPSDMAVDVDLSTGIPAVTHDLRGEGFGILTPVCLDHSNFMVAVQDDEIDWRFFRCRVAHNTEKPGGWFQLGLRTDRVIELESFQRTAFRDHVAAVRQEATATLTNPAPTS
jgi:hypothetical protein